MVDRRQAGTGLMRRLGGVTPFGPNSIAGLELDYQGNPSFPNSITGFTAFDSTEGVTIVASHNNGAAGTQALMTMGPRNGGPAIFTNGGATQYTIQRNGGSNELLAPIFTPSADVVTSVKMSTNDVRVREDGGAWTSASTSRSFSGITSINIGCRLSSGGDPVELVYTGTIYRILVYQGILSDDDVALLEAFLA